MRLNLENLALLFREQPLVWEEARKNFEALKRVEIKEVRIENYPFKVQFNPSRVLSSSAKIDAKSIEERRCFLCSENRPKEQMELAFKGYQVLINPFPIFPHHLTIASIDHTDQLIEGRMGEMLSLSEELPNHILFYNGPKCGASAPDHFHFQAGDRSHFPLVEFLPKLEKELLSSSERGALYLVKELYSSLLIIESMQKEGAVELFERLLTTLPIKEGEREALFNILAWSNGGRYTIALFLRGEHRPSHYFLEGEEKILISPGAVDMAGLIIVPLERDFKRVNSSLIEEILREVSLPKERVEEIKKKLKSLSDE